MPTVMSVMSVMLVMLIVMRAVMYVMQRKALTCQNPNVPTWRDIFRSSRNRDLSLLQLEEKAIFSS